MQIYGKRVETYSWSFGRIQFARRISQKTFYTTNEFFDSFQNKYVNKDTGFRLQRLKAYREDSHMQFLTLAWMTRHILSYFLERKETSN